MRCNEAAPDLTPVGFDGILEPTWWHSMGEAELPGEVVGCCEAEASCDLGGRTPAGEHSSGNGHSFLAHPPLGGNPDVADKNRMKMPGAAFQEITNRLDPIAGAECQGFDLQPRFKWLIDDPP